jgi:hypothetical protein
MDNPNEKAPNVPRVCKVCNKIRSRILAKTFADGSKYYVDENGKKWLGQTGPCCTKKARKGYYKGKDHPEASCAVCKTSFKPRAVTQLYCSEVCAEKAHNEAKEVRVIDTRKLTEE